MKQGSDLILFTEVVTKNIIIITFTRRFYPKRLTVHSVYTCIVSMCDPWELNPQHLRC